MAQTQDTKPEDVIYDWNTAGQPPQRPRVQLFDESLRDGIQSPSAVDPSIEVKVRFIHLLEQLGVQVVDIGLPGAGPRAQEAVLRLAREIEEKNLTIAPACAARTVVADIRPIVEISQKTGLKIEVMTFIGSSPIRSLAEQWDEPLLAKRSAEAIRFAHQAGLPVTYVTEDTVRSRPETLERLFKTALDEGAKGLCLCDTVGHATREGVQQLIGWTRDLVDRHGYQAVIDWHGHNDRGLALSNALVAADAGADRVHGTVLGIGERVGNTALDLMLVNLKLLGLWDRDLSALNTLCQLTSEACELPIPLNYPVLGTDAFRTATGVHAAAVIKATRTGMRWLADRIYSGVPAAWFGREQEIVIGHMSGLSNVTFWLERQGLAPREGLAEAILARAKQGDRLLTRDEILEIVQAHPA